MTLRMFKTEQESWNATCGCSKPSIYFSRDFETRTCQNCGVILISNVEPQVVVPFVHLRVHTHLSLLRATCKIEDLISKAKEYGLPALAKTEFDNMCGAPSFVKQCQDEDIKPILGTTFKVKYSDDFQFVDVTVIALNREGYKKLVKLNTIAWCERKAKKVPVHLLNSDLRDIGRSGLVVLLDMSTTHVSAIANIASDLGKSHTIYLEYNLDSQELGDIARSIKHNFGIPTVATGRVLFVNEEDHDAYKIALKIGKHEQDQYIADKFCNNWFKPADRFTELFGFDNEWVENSFKIAEQVEDYGIVNKEFIVPTFKDKSGEWPEDKVHSKLEMDSWTGLAKKGLSENQEYIDRLQYELDTMKDKKFSSYFLIIADIIQYMIDTDKLAPFGRGSSVGSLVCYALDVISMDPIRWKVPFERFINQGRKDLPDIDTDITQEGRQDVLRYIADTHGHDRVAQIATFQTLKLKASIDNVGRILDVNHALNREIRKEIPDDCTEMEDLPANVKKEMSNYTGWYETAESLLNISKNLGYHAAGVVIGNQPLGELCPLLPPDEEGGLIGIQYDMHDCEILGLLKLDMLGLRNLDIIQHTLGRIKRRHEIDVDVYNLSPDDSETFDLVTTGEYVSVFQLDSPGYRKLCRQLRPRSFEHIMALNALFRPGPLESGVTDQYVKRRHGQEAAVSWHPWLDDVLNDTYQTVLFQEQAMAMSRIIAGFSDVEADKFRKGIGKKIPEVVEAVLTDFKQGAMVREGLTIPPGWTGTLEQWIDDLIKKLHGYARYMWNRGHSAGYGWITYVTAYLEAHYPHEYYAALLDAADKPHKISTFIRNILYRGYKVVPPHINESGSKYKIGSDNNIYMGLSAVKSVGKSANDILIERDRGGPFSSFISFCQRLPKVSKTVKVNLVKAGSFSWDTSLCDRDKIDNTDIINKFARKRNKKYDGSKVMPLQIAMECHVEGYEYTDLEAQKNERAVLNSFITGHPAAVYQRLAPYLMRGECGVISPSSIHERAIGETVLLVAMIDNIRKKDTIAKPNRQSRPFISMNVSDSESYLIVNIWHPLCERYDKYLVSDQLVMFEGVVRKDKFKENANVLSVNSAVMLTNGLPIQGIKSDNGVDMNHVVSSIGGHIQQLSQISNQQFASLRGSIMVKPDILEQAVAQYRGIKFLVAMDQASE